MCENRSKQADFPHFFKPQEARNRNSDEQSSHPRTGAGVSTWVRELDALVYEEDTFDASQLSGETTLIL